MVAIIKLCASSQTAVTFVQIFNYRIVRIISPWAIFLTSALNRGWAYNTSWAYNVNYHNLIQEHRAERVGLEYTMGL